MGMFDFVRSEVTLPDGFDGELQTKSFDSTLATILIKADGRLLIEEVQYERLPPKEGQLGKPLKLGFLGELQRKSSRWRDINFHGDFSFYGLDDKSGQWHGYVARFTHGELEYILPQEEAW